MKLFGEKVKQTFTNSPFNIIQVKDFQETFFDVYEIELNNGKYPVEKISEQDGIPMVNIPIIVEGQETLRPFLLTKGKENALMCGINFDTMLEDVPHETIEEDVEEPMVVVEEKEISKEDHSKLLEEISQAKQDAREYAEKIKRQKLQEANKEIENKQQALDQMLENARSSLVDEFVTISEKVRDEFVSENDERFEIINHTINEKIHELSNNLREALIEDFDKSEQAFGEKLDEMVAEVYAALSPRVNKELSEIVENFEKKIETFSEVNSKLDEKLDKNVNKALSRIGNVDRKYESLLSESETKFDEKLQKVESSVVEFYQEKLSLLEDKTLNLNDETKKYFVDLLNESKRYLLEEIEEVKKEKSVEFIIEKNGEKSVIDEGKLITKLETALNSKISDVETSLRKYVSVYAGGGGTVATQYQDGGTMNGDLVINGKITATEYEGLPPLPELDFLPLSGGEIDGNLAVVGSLSASEYLGLDTEINADTESDGTANLSVNSLSTQAITFNDNATFTYGTNGASNHLLALSASPIGHTHTNAEINTAISADPAASRTALGGGAAGQAVFTAATYSGTGSVRNLLSLDTTSSPSFAGLVVQNLDADLRIATGTANTGTRRILFGSALRNKAAIIVTPTGGWSHSVIDICANYANDNTDATTADSKINITSAGVKIVGPFGINSAPVANKQNLAPSSGDEFELRINSGFNTGIARLAFCHTTGGAKAAIISQAAGTFSKSTGIRFAISDDAAELAIADTKMILTPAGRLGIGNNITPTVLCDVDGEIRTRSKTVANLTAAATAGAGARAFVSDSTVAASGNFGATVTGGGSNSVPVYSDGTNWRIG